MSCNCNGNGNNIDESPWAGTDIKLLLNPQATGFDAKTDDWEVEIRYGQMGKLLKRYKKSDMTVVDDRYLIVIDTTGMNSSLYAVVYAFVPDSDCEGRVRKEVLKKFLCNVNNV